MIDDKILKLLEYDKILQKIASYSVAEVTKEVILGMRPRTCMTEAEHLLDQTDAAYYAYYKYRLRPVTAFDTITGILEKSKAEAILTPAELLRVSRLLRAARIARKSLENAPNEVTALTQIVQGFNINEALEKEIDTCILGENEISDHASTALRDIRRKLLSLNQKLKEKLHEYSRSSEVSKYLQDNIVTIRSGRYVLAVKSECRPSVPGLVHDRSATGATVFVEPFAVVELNNEIRARQLDEAAEIERILKELSQKTAAERDNLTVAEDALVALDAIMSRAHYSASLDCIRPKLNNSGYINLLHSRHPLIDKQKVVPVTLETGHEYRILTITGPNTGGKTVCLKTVGLFCLLAASGVFLPAAEGSEAAVFDSVFADIGDEQSIISSLSTFSSHILNIVGITERVTKNSLVLLDELGSGTDPAEGAALALGILKYIEKAACTAIITTHFNALKEYALLSKNLRNASMQFDEASLSPTYKLIIGLPGTSKALKIAQTLGINKQILDDAYASLSQETTDFEAVLREAENAKRAALEELERTADERRALGELRRQLKEDKNRLDEKMATINSGARAEINRLASKAAEKAEELIEELKEKLKREDEKALFEARQIIKKIEAVKDNAATGGSGPNPDSYFYKDVNPKELKAGDEVFIKALNIIGRVVEVFPKKKEARIMAGAAGMNISFGGLAYAPVAKDRKPSLTQAVRQISGGSTKEIDVRGMIVSEAIEIIEPYIIDMFGGGGDKLLRIIHGKGTGALGRGIQTYLRSNKAVASFRYGGYGEGDNGVTIAEIK